jgi:hypothetical protein
MTAQRVLDNARVARELGVGTVILDDGWFGTGLDDDHGALNLGDYEPDPRKFPDLRGHVADLQALGLKVLLWHAPLCVAPSSRTYGRLRQLLIHQHGREFVSVNGLGMLCPACPEVRQYVADETRRLFAAYGVDGLKADLYNCLPVGPCESTAHSHDVADGVGAVEAVMEAQWAAAREARPDALVELKQDYASVRLARYGTMVRAGDTAYDVDTNCRRCFYAQAYAPCVHNDYFVTSRHATPRAVALAMIRMLAAGVPTFGGDWLTTPAEQQNIIRAWLDLYRRKIGIFRLPREPQTNDLSAWQGGNAVEAWVAAIWNGREIRLPEAGSVVVMNGTDRDDLYLRLPHPSHAEIETVDFRGRSAGQSRMRVTDGGRVAIPSGGRAEITVTASESSSLSLP